MLEGNAEVDASRIVYDPQNPFLPQPFHRRKATDKIAYILNASEARRLIGTDDVRAAGKAIISDLQADIAVIKRGPWGALIFEGNSVEEVPAYRTDHVWPIGSGDVFASTFAAYWASQGRSAIDSAALASRATAMYVDTRVLPISTQTIENSAEFPYNALKLQSAPAQQEGFDVYLAGPFFNIGQLWLVEESRIAMSGMGLRVFSPYHEIGLGAAHDVAPKDLDGLNRSSVVFAIVDGLDSGTLFEIGYARAMDKPVIALASSTPEEALKMITGTGCEMLSDFVTAIYRASWAARR
jgi:nucleoside 2-deoxyribosyltransferase